MGLFFPRLPHGEYQLYNESKVIQEIKVKRVGLLGHLFWTDERYTCRKLTFTNLGGTRKAGWHHTNGWIVLKKRLNELTTGKPRQWTEWTKEHCWGDQSWNQAAPSWYWCHIHNTLLGPAQKRNLQDFYKVYKKVNGVFITQFSLVCDLTFA
jgi:hypothetical protein